MAEAGHQMLTPVTLVVSRLAENGLARDLDAKNHVHGLPSR
jgi:hypothetical protein